MAVVVGATVVMGTDAICGKPRSSDMRSCIWCQPSPSSTSMTIWSAPSSPAGNHAGGWSGSSTSTSTMLEVHAPSYAGSTGCGGAPWTVPRELVLR